ncbi:MAG: glycosyltransferase [Hyphomicrobiales bacterium]|nr:MAG: glycosyltransferase [Hyphomicrobiales bacterium]
MVIPAISVLLPIRNGERFLGSALESIVSQSFTDLEIICIDDGSSDATPEMLRAFQERDTRIRVITLEGKGLVNALNIGLAEARSSFVARMDADDIAMPKRLESQYAHMIQNDDLLVLGTRTLWINEEGIELKPPRFVKGRQEVAKALECKCVICHPTVLMRRIPIMEMGGYRCAYECAEDFDLWLRASERGSIDNLDFVGLKYRIHAANVGATRLVQQQISTALAIATHKLRIGGKADPTDGLSKAPDIGSAQFLGSLIPGELRFFQLVDFLLRDNFEYSRAKLLVDGQDPEILVKHAKLWHWVLTRLALAAPLADTNKWRLLARALALHPGRTVKALRRVNRGYRP